MKVVQINTFSYKATGSIMFSIHRELQRQGHDSYVVWGRGRDASNDHEIKMTDDPDVITHGIYSRLTDRTGFASLRATKQLIRRLEIIGPDIIHLHNLHGYYINIELLFDYIKRKNIKVVWTLHDCWSFTGHCAYFDMAGCGKWKTGCEKCTNLNTYPASWGIDASGRNWLDKQRLFQGLNITLAVPCRWLMGKVKQSFLKEYPVQVIYNGVDTEAFRPLQSGFRERNGLNDEFLIMGVASEWKERKGLQDFIKLDALLAERESGRYRIVLAGVTKKQKRKLPDSFISLERTSGAGMLSEIYSAADVLFNPTYEDTYPTVNLEAICCGTPVITYRTGGSPESIDGTNGFVVEQGGFPEAAGIIEANFRRKMGLWIDRGAAVKKYGNETMQRQYLLLYEKILSE